jgi:hypothetical protein
MLGRQVAVQEAQHVRHLLHEVVDADLTARRQGAGGELVAAGRSADAEIDPARMEGLEHPERFRRLQCAVVLQHHPARADSDARRGRRHLRDEDLGARSRQRRRGMMLGQPVAVIPEPVGRPGQVEGLADSNGGRVTAANGRLVGHAEAEHCAGAYAIKES